MSTTTTSTSEVARESPESAPEDQRRQRHLSQLAEARKKAVEKNREARKRREERFRELEDKVSKVEREKDMQDAMHEDPPVVVTKRARREEPHSEAPKSFASGLPMDLMRGLAAGGLSLLSLYLSNRMRSSVAPPSFSSAAPIPNTSSPPPKIPEPEPQPSRGPPRPSGVPFVGPSTPVIHKSGFVAV
jgi:hypothetical protein